MRGRTTTSIRPDAFAEAEQRSTRIDIATILQSSMRALWQTSPIAKRRLEKIQDGSGSPAASVCQETNPNTIQIRQPVTRVERHEPNERRRIRFRWTGDCHGTLLAPRPSAKLPSLQGRSDAIARWPMPNSGASKSRRPRHWIFAWPERRLRHRASRDRRQHGEIGVTDRTPDGSGLLFPRQNGSRD